MAFTVKLYLDKSKNKVAFAESDSYFVDALLSFLTMPMGTIVRLLNNSSQLGCFDNLRRSIEDLGDSCFTSEASRAMLLQPRNSEGQLLRSMAGNLDYLEDPTGFYVCKDLEVGHSRPRPLSRFRNVKCSCGSPMNVEVRLQGKREEGSCDGGVFVNVDTKFVVTDGLVVNVASTAQLIRLLEESGVGDGDLEEREVTVGREELLHLLRRSLISDTALTDVFMKGKTCADAARYNPHDVIDLCVGSSRAEDAISSNGRSVELKLVVDEIQNHVLYAEAKQGGFADLISSFLTFPLGAMLRLLGGKSSIVCADNLYKSVELLGDSSMTSHKMTLLDPKLALFYSCKHQPIFVAEGEFPRSYYLCRSAKCYPDALIDLLQYSCKKCEANGRFLVQEVDPNPDRSILKAAKLIVMDDLSVKPFSLRSCLDSLKIDGGNSDGRRSVVERNVVIGEQEALVILRACLISKTALSDALLK